MNGAWNLGYADCKASRERLYAEGPVAIIGTVAADYLSGYAAANRDRIWANNNRPPMWEEIPHPHMNASIEEAVAESLRK